MKIAITGKGGVGKSTIISLIARVLRDKDYKVIAIDADPDMNLACLLGIPDQENLLPIVDMKELIAERTGTEVGKSSPIYKMNPEVDDIPEKYCREHNGVRLVIMGTVKKGGAGCACPENTFLKTLLGHLLVNREEWVLLDMEAGIEHLGRGTAVGVDEMLVVVEPTRTSTMTAHRIKKLAKDIGITKIQVIGNKIRTPAEEQFIKDNLEGFEILGFLKYDEDLNKINKGEVSSLNIEGDIVNRISALVTAAGWENHSRVK